MKSFCRNFGTVVLILAIVMIVIWGQDYITVFSEPVDINEEYPEDYTKVKAVETDIYMLLGGFAKDELVTKNKRGQITSQSCDYYYVVPIFTEEDTYYVGIVVDSEKSAPYDEISELSWKYLSGELDYLGEEMIEFQGGFIKMEDELYEQFQRWFVDRGYFTNEEELTEYVLPLVLQTMDYEYVRTMAFISAGALLVSVFLLILGYWPSRKGIVGATNETITIHGTAYPSGNFEEINVLVQTGKTDKAVKELQRLINIDEADAAAVIQRWYAYWGS